MMYEARLFRITAWYVMQVNGQPAAVNMREMVWDEELARLAQRFSRNFYFSTTIKLAKSLTLFSARSSALLVAHLQYSCLVASMAYSRLLHKGWHKGCIEFLTIFAFKIQFHSPV
jgi:hypothetical protein